MCSFNTIDPSKRFFLDYSVKHINPSYFEIYIKKLIVINKNEAMSYWIPFYFICCVIVMYVTISLLIRYRFFSPSLFSTFQSLFCFPYLFFLLLFLLLSLPKLLKKKKEIILIFSNHTIPIFSHYFAFHIPYLLLLVLTTTFL